MNLINNRISDRGAYALANALRTNDSILDLDLSFNQISNKGAQAIIEALQNNRKIKRIDLSQNPQVSKKHIDTLIYAQSVNKVMWK